MVCNPPLLPLRVKHIFQLTDPMNCGHLIVPRSPILVCALLVSEAYCEPPAASPVCASVSQHFWAVRMRRELHEELHSS